MWEVEVGGSEAQAGRLGVIGRLELLTGRLAVSVVCCFLLLVFPGFFLQRGTGSFFDGGTVESWLASSRTGSDSLGNLASIWYLIGSTVITTRTSSSPCHNVSPRDSFDADGFGFWRNSKHDSISANKMCQATEIN